MPSTITVAGILCRPHIILLSCSTSCLNPCECSLQKYSLFFFYIFGILDTSEWAEPLCACQKKLYSDVNALGHVNTSYQIALFSVYVTTVKLESLMIFDRVEEILSMCILTTLTEQCVCAALLLPCHCEQARVELHCLNY